MESFSFRLTSLAFDHNRSVQSPQCRLCTNPLVDLPLHSSLTYEQDPDVLKLFHFGQNLLRKKGLLVFPAKKHGSRIGRADSYPDHFTLSCGPIQRELEVTDWWSQQNHIICKEQKLHSEVTKPEALITMATSRNSVNQSQEQNRCQRAALAESNLHLKQVQLIAGVL